MEFSDQNRHLIVISGEKTACLSYAKKLTHHLESLFLDNPKKATEFLGQEFDAVILNAVEYFDANAFGAISGTIRTGGYFILLLPEGDSNHIKSSLFFRRFSQLLNTHPYVFFLNSLDQKNNPLAKPIKKQHQSQYATRDQHNTVDAMLHVVKGHRRRPLVITSDRGRGKSASLGIAASKLLKDDLLEGKQKTVIICAPSKKSAAVVIQYANNSRLIFYSPDELQQQKPKADLVLIDEASAIPVALLTEFLKHYSRIVFATTQHGYEGSGRGFVINFRKILDEKTPNWVSCKLKQPIRWNEDDALEAFTFKALLLNAEPVKSALVKDAEIKCCNFMTLDKQTLVQNEEQLHNLFGLLVSAHYQTKPSDLMQMLDDKDVSIHALTFNQQFIAVALVIHEGGLDAKLSQAIFEGKRRIKGNLVAQALAANAGIASAPTLTGERVSRIAVHPSLQQQGFGTYLLEQIIKSVDADYVSTSFGATKPVINFWEKSDFTPVYLGMKRDASSGSHSVLMLHPKTEKGQDLLVQAKKRFSQHFPYLLSEPFRQLEADIALSLLSNTPLQVTESERNELLAFANEQRGYENTLYPLWVLVTNMLAKADLIKLDKQILLYKVLQKHSWQTLVSEMGISGKKEALRLVREAIRKLLAFTSLV